MTGTLDDRYTVRVYGVPPFPESTTPGELCHLPEMMIGPFPTLADAHRATVTITDFVQHAALPGGWELAAEVLLMAPPTEWVHSIVSVSTLIRAAHETLTGWSDR